ncbi:MAG: hypothetical protein IJK08_08225 [Prevotella sp.]|nr:hypothetical protein [Prevotella sp.]
MNDTILLGSSRTILLVVVTLSTLASHDSSAQSAERNYVLTHHMLDSCGTAYSEHILYSDGLGRPVIACSSLGSDTYSCELSVYGYGGTLSRHYVPVPGNGEWLTTTQASAAGQATYPGETRLNSTVTYDALGRQISELGPGSAWETGSHAATRSFGTNETGEVRKYMVSGQTLSLQGHYASGRLRSVTETGEDGIQCTTFTDLQGHVVMTRDNTGGETYYVLDAWGDPVVVMPPAASQAMAGGGPWNLASSADVLRWCYIYTYDMRRRRTSARLPGCGERTVCYDSADRPVFTQDSVLRASGRCAFTLYDPLGRPAVTGTCSASCIVSAAAATATAIYDGSGPYGGYSCSLSLQDVELLTVTWYDRYEFLSILQDDSLSFAAVPGYASAASTATGLVTGRAAYSAVGGGKPLLTTLYYDTEGRVIQEHSTNVLGGHEVTSTAWTFDGRPSLTTHIHTAPGHSSLTEIISHTYDSHTGMPLTTTHSVNGSAPATLSSLTYDAVGRVATKTVGGLETTAYTYNVRSWPTRLLGQRFTERLCYNTAVEGLSPVLEHEYRYDGTVAAYACHVAGETFQRGYTLMYDGLNRLTAAHYGESSSLGSYHTKYDEMAEYDCMGNPTWIYRRSPDVINDIRPSSPSDRLRLEYDGNQLVHVTDSVTSGHNYAGAFHFADGADETVEYEYDGNGNMTKDLNRNITSIEYNLLNLPSMISFGDNSFIKYTYSATGEKLGVEYGVRLQPVLSPTGRDAIASESADATETMQDRSGGFDPGPLVPMAMDGITYCGNVVYDGDEVKLLTDEGYVTFTATGTPQYHYYLRDHLGNIRVVMGQTGAVEQVNHYYAFGGLMRESSNPGVQPYKFGGKELDRTSGLDAYDFGARMYFADRMQWSTMDPLCEKYYDVSPYVYCHNNPMNRIDVYGMWDTLNISNNKNNVMFVISDKYKKDEALQRDYDKAFNLGLPIVLVHNIKDFSDALSAIGADNIKPTVTLNSHGRPGLFYIGNEKVTKDTDMSSLDLLSQSQIVITACRTAEGEKGEKLLNNIARQLTCTVYGSCHFMKAGYEYDGSIMTGSKPSNTFMMEGKSYTKDNLFKVSNFEKSKYIFDLSIDRVKGLKFNEWNPIQSK